MAYNPPEGYPVDIFVEEVEEADLCGICSEVMEEATETPCGHAYCTKCIRYWMRKDSVCPQDREPLKWADCRPMVRDRRRILSMKIKCEWCDNEMELRSLKEHQPKCEEKPDGWLPPVEEEFSEDEEEKEEKEEEEEEVPEMAIQVDQGAVPVPVFNFDPQPISQRSPRLSQPQLSPQASPRVQRAMSEVSPRQGGMVPESPAAVQFHGAGAQGGGFAALLMDEDSMRQQYLKEQEEKDRQVALMLLKEEKKALEQQAQERAARRASMPEASPRSLAAPSIRGVPPGGRREFKQRGGGEGGGHIGEGGERDARNMFQGEGGEEAWQPSPGGEGWDNPDDNKNGFYQVEREQKGERVANERKLKSKKSKKSKKKRELEPMEIEDPERQFDGYKEDEGSCCCSTTCCSLLCALLCLLIAAFGILVLLFGFQETLEIVHWEDIKNALPID